MSVTFHLYEVDKDVHFKGSKWYCNTTKEMRKKVYEMDYDASEGLFKEVYEKNGEQVEGWDYISVSLFRSLARVPSCRRCRRFLKYAEKLKTFGTDIISTFFGAMEVLPVKEVLYRQGWFVSDKFLNKKCTFYLGTTKEEVKRFFDKYLDVKRDDRGYEAREAFLSNWKDGMIFYVAW